LELRTINGRSGLIVRWILSIDRPCVWFWYTDEKVCRFL